MPAIGKRLNIGEFKMSRYNNNLQFIRRKNSIHIYDPMRTNQIKINKIK